jgi:hypothetical protein
MADYVPTMMLATFHIAVTLSKLKGSMTRILLFTLTSLAAIDKRRARIPGDFHRRNTQ